MLKYECKANRDGFTKGETYHVRSIVSEGTVMALNDDGKLVPIDVHVINDDEQFELVEDETTPKKKGKAKGKDK